jgi:hypothetical protein
VSNLGDEHPCGRKYPNPQISPRKMFDGQPGLRSDHGEGSRDCSHSICEAHTRDSGRRIELLKHRTAHSRRSSVPASYERISKQSFVGRRLRLNSIH